MKKVIKRGMSILLAVMIMLSVFISAPFPLSASASGGDDPFSGISTPPTAFTYGLLNGTYISITGYTGSDAVIVIPGEIDGYIVQTIGSGAFQNKSGLQGVRFPASLERIGTNAFAGCTSLAQIGFNPALQAIENSAFSGCTALSAVTVPGSVTTLSDRVFSGCTALSEVSLGEGLTTIASRVFLGCTALQSILLPNSVTTMGHAVFENCSQLSSVNFPLNWTTADTNLFPGTAVKNIVVPEGVSRIPDYAFSYGSTLESVTLPSTLIEIGSHAFYQSGLLEIELPAGLKTIRDTAFYGCNKLTEVDFPDGLETIGSNAFNSCTGLTEISISANMKTLGSGVFGATPALRTIHLAEGIEKIWNSAFSGCTGIKTITLPTTLKTIDANAFAGCTGLTSLTVPASVTSIGNSAFSGCTGLNSISLQEGLMTLGNYVFDDCTALRSVRLPDSVQTIGIDLFRNCAKLSSVNFPRSWTTATASYGMLYGTAVRSMEVPEGVARIPNNAFYNCSTLESVSLPSTLTEIGISAFYGCSELPEIWVGAHVTSIQTSAFANCPKLTIHGVAGSKAEQYATANNIPFSTDPLVPEGYASLAGRIVDSGSAGLASVAVNVRDLTKNRLAGTYMTDADGGWQMENAVVGTTYLVQYYHPQYSFSQNNFVVAPTAGGHSVAQVTAALTFPAVTTPAADFSYTVLNGTYSNITGYTGSDAVIAIPGEIDGYIVQTIGNGAFQNKSGLQGVLFPSSLEQIGTNAFSGCTGLTKVGFNYGLQTIETGAFSGCTNLNALTIPASVTTLQDRVFSGCTNLSALTLSEGLTTITSRVFEGCAALQSVRLPDSITTMGYGVFRNCTQLSSVNFPKNWATAGSGSSYPLFAGTAVKNIVLPEGVTRIPDNAFSYCSMLESVTLPSTLIEIGGSAFVGCSGLREIEFPEGLKTIGNYAFQGCNQLTEINFPDVLENIGSNALSGCTGLTELSLPAGIKSVGSSAFSGIPALKTIHLAEGIEKIWNSAFSGCTGLKTITLPTTLKTIEASAFTGCTGLTSLEIPALVTNIQNSAFNGCTGLTNISFSEGLTTLGNYVFDNCSSLRSVHLPDSVTTTGIGVFRGCAKLSSINFPKNWTTAGNTYGLLYGTAVRSIVVPEGVTRIPNDAFYNCGTLESVSLPSTLTEIGLSAFCGCGELSKIWVGPHVQSILTNAFASCPKLTIHGESGSKAEQYASANSIPFSTEPIVVDEYASIAGRIVDSGNEGLASVTVTVRDLTKNRLAGTHTTDENGEWQGESAVVGSTYIVQYYHSQYSFSQNRFVFELESGGHSVAQSTATLTFPTVTTPAGEFTYTALNGTYISITGYTGSAAVIAIPGEIDGHIVQTIGTSAFQNKSGLQGVLLPDSLERIGTNAFLGCTGLTKVGFNYGLQTIEAGAFSGCTNLNAVIIPASVTSLQDRVFSGCTNLSALTLSEGLTTITSRVFEGCAALQSVRLPDSISAMGSSVFRNCTQLSSINFPKNWATAGSGSSYALFAGTAVKNIVVPEGVTRIPDNAFSYCSMLESVTLPSTLIEIGGSAFVGCSGLREIELPDGLKTIRSSAFSGCNQLMEIEFPEALETIDSNAFSGCTGLTEISISANMKSIGNSAFSGIPALKTIRLAEGIERIWNSAFSGCTGIQTIALPSTLKTIEGSAFNGCTSLSSLTIPASVTSIGASVFTGCTALTNISLSEGLMSIGNYAFDHCSALQSIHLPDSVTTIGYAVFRNCERLSSVNFPKNWTTAAASSSYPIFYGTAVKSIIVPEGVTRIPDGAFYYCGTLESVTLPSTLTEIGGSAFTGCVGLREIEFPAGLKTIRGSAFYGCNKLTELEFPEGLETIESNAFTACTGLTEISVPANMKSIGSNAFSNSSSLKTINLSEGIEKIWNSAFSGCIGLKTINLPDTLKTIETNAFNGCTGLTSVTIPESVTALQDGAFASCTGLTNVSLSEGLLTLGHYVFENCTALQSIRLPDSITTMGRGVFRNSTKLSSVNFPLNWTTANYTSSYPLFAGTAVKSIAVPEGVTRIPNGSFFYCSTLESVSLPGSLTEIGNDAFNGCSGLLTINVPKSVKTIGSNAFTSAPKLVLSCARNSYAVRYAIDNNVKFAYNGEEDVFETPVLEDQNSYYIVDPEGSTENGVISAKIHYELKAGVSGVTNQILKIRLSANAGVVSGSFYLNGALVSNYTVSNGVLSLPVTQSQGDVRFQITPTAAGTIASYAMLEYRKDSRTRQDIIGVLDNDQLKITIVADELIFSERVAVSGIAAANALVSIYADGVLLTTIRADGSGKYSVIVTLPNVQSYSVYQLRASYTAGEDVISAVTQVIFQDHRYTITDFSAQKIYSKTVKLIWLPLTDPEVTGYEVRRDGQVVAETEDSFFVDTGLTLGETYAYTVKAVTGTALDDGLPVSSLSVTTIPPAPKSIYDENADGILRLNDNRIYVSVARGKNNYALNDTLLTGKLYYLEDGVRRLIGTPALHSSSDTQLIFSLVWDFQQIPFGDYTLLFELEDIDGTKASVSKEFFVDSRRPDKIVNVVAVGDYNKIMLSWGISSEVDSSTYRIFRKAEQEENYSLLTTIQNRNTLSYTDNSAADNILYFYYVVTVNSYGIASEPSLTVSAVKAKDVQPPTVTRLLPEEDSILNKTETITVNAVDNFAATSAKLYYSLDGGESWVLIGEKTPPLSFGFNTTDLPDGAVKLKALAYDAAGNESQPLVYNYTIKNAGPQQVTGLRTTGTVYASQLTLAWNDVADEDVSHFLLERKEGANYATVSGKVTSLGYNVGGLQGETAYTFRVAAVDVYGNVGPYSADFTVTTAPDTTAPVITAQSPSPGRYNSSISFRATANDDCGIQSIVIQASRDRQDWETLSSQTFLSRAASASYTYALSLEDYEDGSLFVRGIATDFSGNVSNSGGNAPLVEYHVDKTPPEAPSDVQANGGDGFIRISWKQGTEVDLGSYAVYRSETADGTYTQIAGGLQVISYYDTKISYGKNYFYKVRVSDFCGSWSAYSDVVSSRIADDVTPPQIVSVSPANGSNIGFGTKTVQALAQDNNCLEEIVVEYKLNGAANYTVLQTFSTIGDYYKTVAAELPMDSFANGDTVHIRLRAKDIVGLYSPYTEVTYHVVKNTPAFDPPEAVLEGDNVTLTWSDKSGGSIAGYKVYRIKNGGTPTMIGSRTYSTSNSYTFADSLRSRGDGDYVYRVEVYDIYGNFSARDTAAIHYVQQTAGDLLGAEITAAFVWEVGVEGYFDAGKSTPNGKITGYLWEFGDGTTSTLVKPVKKYTRTGDFTVSLTVTDSEGASATASRTVEVRERTAIGTLRVLVQDDSGNALRNFPVYFDLGEANQIILPTDSSGYVSLALSSGNHLVGTYRDGYLPAQKTVTVLANATRTVTLVAVEQPIVTGEFEVTRMTFNEIVAAGINVNDPDNQHVFSVSVQLWFGETAVPVQYIRNGKEILSWSFPSGWGGIPSGGGTPGSGVGNSGGNRVGSIAYIPNERGFEYIAVLEVPFKGSILKEFFDVKLHIVNNATEEFSLINNTVALSVPEGMTMMRNLNGSFNESAEVFIDEILGQQTKTLNWVLRGDRPGEYDLSARFDGTLAVFNEPVSAIFKTDEKIKVYGLEGLTVRVETNDEIKYNALYFNLGMVNKSQIDILNPRLDFDGIVKNITASAKRAAGVEPKPGEEDYDVSAYLLNVRHVFADGTERSLPFTYDLNGNVLLDLTTLAPGESLVYEYAAYNAIEYDGIAYFHHAVVEEMSEYCPQVEVVPVHMDLFKTNAYRENFSKLQSASGETKAALGYLLDNDNYIYHSNSSVYEKAAEKIGQSAYNNLKLLATLDLEALTHEEFEKMMREIFVQVITDDTVYDNVDSRMAAQYAKAFKNLLSALKTTADFTEPGDAQAFAESVDRVLQSDEALYALAESYENFGGVGAGDSLFRLLGEGLSPVGAAYLKTQLSDPFSDADSAFFKGLSGTGKYGGMLISLTALPILEAGEDAERALYIHSMLQRQACAEEALFVLNTIIDAYSNDSRKTAMFRQTLSSVMGGIVPGSTAILPFASSTLGVDPTAWISDSIVDVAEDMKEKLLDNSLDAQEAFLQSLTSQVAQEGVKLGARQAIKKVLGKANVWYTLLGTSFELLDNRMDLEEKYRHANALEGMNYISMALVDEFLLHMAARSNPDLLSGGLNYPGETVEQDALALNAIYLLKALSKTRLIGEQAVKLYIDGDNSTVLQSGGDKIAAINERFGTDYASTAELFEAVYRNILEARDIVFNIQAAVTLPKPPAPAVTIDYETLRTVQTFDSSFEYSLADGVWKPCNGGTIPVTPKSTASILRVRKASGNEAPAGEIATVTIYARKTLSKTITAQYDAGVYHFKNLSALYEYEFCLLSDQEATPNWANAVTVAGGYDASAQSAQTGGYLAIRAKANDALMEMVSETRVVPVGTRQLLTIIIEGGGKVIQSRADGKYLVGETVELTAKANSGTLFSGWFIDGSLVSSDENYLLEMTENASIRAKFIPDPDASHTHSYTQEAILTPAACESAGERKLSCPDDGEFITQPIPATGHRWNNGVVTTAPTVEQEGVRTFTCQNDPSHTKTEPIAKLPPVPLQSISLSKTAATLKTGKTLTLTVTYNPTTTTDDKTVKWTTSDATIISVSGGTVTAKKVGTATVTATVSGKTATCKITVEADKIEVTRVIIVNPPVNMIKGKSVTLNAAVSPADATDKTLAWSSSDKTIATVDAKTGKVSAKKSGVVTITAKADGKSASCKITVHSYASMRLGYTKAIQNGVQTTIDSSGAKAFKINGRTMLPVRFVGTALGATVTYTSDKDPIYIKTADITVALKINEKTMKVTKGSKTKTMTLDVAATKKDGRVYLPLRAIGEALEFDVYYKQEGSAEYVIVNTPAMTAAVKAARLEEAKKYLK